MPPKWNMSKVSLLTPRTMQSEDHALGRVSRWHAKVGIKVGCTCWKDCHPTRNLLLASRARDPQIESQASRATMRTPSRRKASCPVFWPAATSTDTVMQHSNSTSHGTGATAKLDPWLRLHLPSYAMYNLASRAAKST